MLRFLRAVLFAALPIAAAWPVGAAAHAILLDSQPAARGAATAGPVRFTLRFNSRIDRGRSRLLLRAPDGERALPIAPEGGVDTLEAAADLRPGSYTLRWQVLAVDGHITRGDVPFEVKAP